MRYYLFIIGISLFPLYSLIFNSHLVHTHDGFVHLARIAAYSKALYDGQFPVRWAADLNYGYGMPLFNFIYHTPYLISSFFLKIGFGLVNSFKITLILSFIFSGIFMLLFANAFFQDKKKALFAAVFYQFSTFRFVELLVRGSFGEVYAYTFLPLILFGLTRLFRSGSFYSFFITAIASALLIISHNAISLVFFGVCILFIIFFAKGKRDYILGITSLLVGILLTAFYWIPAIFEHKYTYGDLFMKNLYLEHFAPLHQFFLPNFTNSKLLQTGGISVQFGLFHLITLIFSIALLARSKKMNKTLKRVIIFSVFIFFIALFFMLPLSNFFWERISVLRQFQFPWRFLAVTTFATSLLSVSFFDLKFFNKKWTYYTILLLVILSSIYYWKPSLGYDKIDEKYYWNFPLNTTYYGETDVVWSAGPAKTYPKQRVEVISGKASIEDFKRKSNMHTFTINSKNRAQFVSHTQYFPGWKVYVDRNPIGIQFQDPNNRGEITFWVPKGKHNVQVIFEESKIRFIANLVSISTFFMLMFIFVFKIVNKRRKLWVKKKLL